MSNFVRSSGLRSSGFKKSTTSSMPSRTTSPSMFAGGETNQKTTMGKRNNDEGPVFYPPSVHDNMATHLTEMASERGNVGEAVTSNKTWANGQGLHSGNWPAKAYESNRNQGSTTHDVQVLEATVEANFTSSAKPNQIMGTDEHSPMYGEEFSRHRARETNSVYANARQLRELVKNNGTQETESSTSLRINAMAYRCQSPNPVSALEPVKQDVERMKPFFQERHQTTAYVQANVPHYEDQRKMRQLPTIASSYMEHFRVERPPPGSPSIMDKIRTMDSEAGGPVTDSDATLLQLHAELRKARHFRHIMSSVQQDPVIRNLLQAITNTIKKLADLSDEDQEILNQWFSIS